MSYKRERELTNLQRERQYLRYDDEHRALKSTVVDGVVDSGELNKVERSMGHDCRYFFYKGSVDIVIEIEIEIEFSNSNLFIYLFSKQIMKNGRGKKKNTSVPFQGCHTNVYT